MDKKLQNTIADSEIEYKEIPSVLSHVKWKVKGTNEEIIISTTRPELICTCGAVIYNPKDKKNKHLNHKVIDKLQDKADKAVRSLKNYMEWVLTQD